MRPATSPAQGTRVCYIPPACGESVDRCRVSASDRCTRADPRPGIDRWPHVAGEENTPVIPPQPRPASPSMHRTPWRTRRFRGVNCHPKTGGWQKYQDTKETVFHRGQPTPWPLRVHGRDRCRLPEKVTEAVWQAGASGLAERVLPRPPWATLVWGPLPLREDQGLVKKLIRPGSGGGRKNVAEKTEDEIYTELYRAWAKSGTKVMGSRNLIILKTSELGPAQVVAYLGPDHGALAALALTEGMSWIPL